MFIRGFAMLLLACLLATSGLAAPLRVTVLTDEGPSSRELIQSLSDKVNPNQIALNVVSTKSAMLPRDTNLVLAVGAQAASIALLSQFDVFCVFISKAGYETLVRDNRPYSSRKTQSVIYLDQPAQRYFKLLGAALPKSQKIGLLYSSPPFELKQLRQLAEQNQYELLEKLSLGGDELHRDLAGLLERSDVLLALPDTQIYNSFTIRNILLESYGDRVPLITYSASLLKAGALMAIISTPEQIASQTLAALMQLSSTGQLPAPQYPHQFDVLVNREVARSLNLALPETAKLHALISRGGGG
jgi:hypothetical protein